MRVGQRLQDEGRAVWYPGRLARMGTSLKIFCPHFDLKYGPDLRYTPSGGQGRSPFLLGPVRGWPGEPFLGLGP